MLWLAQWLWNHHVLLDESLYQQVSVLFGYFGNDVLLDQLRKLAQLVQC